MNTCQTKSCKCNKDIIDVSKWRKEYLEKKSLSCKDRFQIINHPLVSSGKAYWVDQNTICLIK